MDSLKLGEDGLEKRDDGWFVWQGLMTADEVDVTVDVSALHIYGSVRSGGSFSALGKVVIEGGLSVAGDVRCGDYLIVGGELIAGGSVEVGDDLTVGSHTRAGSQVRVVKSLRPGWHLAASAVKAQILFWAALHLPEVPPEKIDVAMVWPVEVSRDYWSQRLGIPLKEHFQELRTLLLPRFNELSSRTNWTPTERWIVESHRAYARTGGTT